MSILHRENIAVIFFSCLIFRDQTKLKKTTRMRLSHSVKNWIFNDSIFEFRLVVTSQENLKRMLSKRRFLFYGLLE